MPNKSPLRYPGGKTRALRILRDAVETHYPGRRTLVSPFLGGGSFELDAASRGYIVRANDLFTPLYTFWSVLQSRSKELHAAVSARLPVSKEVFVELRKTIQDLTDPLAIATSYFIVNRCSFSGATFCGGFSGEASEKRCNVSAVDRLLAVDLSAVHLSSLDGCAFLTQNPETPDTVVYADPPYFISTYVYGKDGDMHEAFDHTGLAACLRTRSDWVLSYNDCPTIRDLYAGCRIQSVSWSYGMNASKPSSEILILPPLVQTPVASEQGP